MCSFSCQVGLVAFNIIADPMSELNEERYVLPRGRGLPVGLLDLLQKGTTNVSLGWGEAGREMEFTY